MYTIYRKAWKLTYRQKEVYKINKDTMFLNNKACVNFSNQIHRFSVALI